MREMECGGGDTRVALEKTARFLQLVSRASDAAWSRMELTHCDAEGYSQTMTSHAANRAAESKDRNPAEYAVLGGLLQGKAHGYDVYRDLKESLGSVHRLGRSQVYGLLSRLERDGLIEHERVEQEGVPDKKVFSLTDEGRSLLTRWIQTPVGSVRDLRVEFLTKLYFAGLESPRVERSLLDAQIAVCRERFESIEARLSASRNRIQQHAFQFRLAMVRASMAWLETMAAEVRKETVGKTD